MKKPESDVFNAALRKAANRGKFTVVESRTRNRETGRFISSEDVNAAVRAIAAGGRVSGVLPAEPVLDSSNA